jgi:hypothetical protein
MAPQSSNNHGNNSNQGNNPRQGGGNNGNHDRGNNGHDGGGNHSGHDHHGGHHGHGHGHDHHHCPPCFYAGTMIATPDGQVAVETLKRGDLVLTTEGRALPVSWLGYRTVSMVFSEPLTASPIRIRAGALAENVPARDLLLSPDHAVLVDGVLAQAGALINGSSIVREAVVPEVFVYYHVEVEDHSLILAENTPAENFVDNVERFGFDNWEEHQALYPEGKSIAEMAYPRAKSQRQVPAATKTMLTARAQSLGLSDDHANVA